MIERTLKPSYQNHHLTFAKSKHAGADKSHPQTRVVRPHNSGSHSRPSSHKSYKPIDPNIKTFFGNIRSMYQDRGLRAFFQGFGPTLIRQVAYSGVQFTTYNAVKQGIHPDSNNEMPTYKIGIAAAVSCMAVVAATQPIDLIKTRMQSINARSVYKTTPGTIYRTFQYEGLCTFWAGSIPRFFKISAGSFLTFMLYESFDHIMQQATKKNPFLAS